VISVRSWLSSGAGFATAQPSVGSQDVRTSAPTGTDTPPSVRRLVEVVGHAGWTPTRRRMSSDSASRRPLMPLWDRAGLPLRLSRVLHLIPGPVVELRRA
jgi:hypothetical protein